MAFDNDSWSKEDSDDTTMFEPGARQPFETISVYGIEESDEPEPERRSISMPRPNLSPKHKRIIAIAAASALVCGLVAVLIGSVLGKGGTDATPAAPETAVVECKQFENIVTATGTLKAGSTVVVTPDVDGTIEKIMVKEGQVVQEGEELFTIKNEELDRAVEEAKREVEVAQQNVTSADNAVSQAEAARDDAWDRYDDAWETADRQHNEWAAAKQNYATAYAAWERAKASAESIKPTDDMKPGPYSSDPEWAEKNQKYQEALAAYEAALANVGEAPSPAGTEPTYPSKPDDVALQAAITNAKDSQTAANLALTKAQADFEQASKNAEKRTVKSPAAGNVTSLDVKVGESVKAATGSSSENGSTLAQIISDESMGIDVEVNEVDILSVKKGQWAKASFSALPDVEANVIVSEVASAASGKDQNGSAFFHVGMVIPQPDSRLRAGMSADVKLVTASVANAIVVPARAITEDDTGTSVLVVIDEDDMVTEKRAVTLGVRGSTEVVVEGGLNEGEVVLLNSSEE